MDMDHLWLGRFGKKWIAQVSVWVLRVSLSRLGILDVGSCTLIFEFQPSEVS